MATKFGKGVTYYEKLHALLVYPLSHTTLSTRGHVRSHDKLETFYLYYHNTNPRRLITYNTELPSIKSCSFYHVV